MLGKIGIVIGLCGAILTLWEWVRPYKGATFNHERDPLKYGIDPVNDGALPIETAEYQLWAKRRRKLILIGIVMMIIGALGQII